MTYKQKAGLVAWMHFFYILIVIVSLPLLFLISWWYKVALVLAISTFLSWIPFKGYCWITRLENKFLKQYNPDSYNNGFIEHYSKKFFNTNFSPVTLIVILDSYLLSLFILSLLNFLY